MKTTNEVIKAVQDKEELLDIELRCAIVALHSYRMSFFFDLARFCVEIEHKNGLQPKTIRGLKRAWEHTDWLNKDLETFILNSSRSPLLTREEQKEKFLDHTAETAEKLFNVLSDAKKN